MKQRWIIPVNILIVTVIIVFIAFYAKRIRQFTGQILGCRMRR